MKSPRYRDGFSLLETILSLALLSIALAVLGELARGGSRHAGAARDLTQAQILCDSRMNEIIAGIEPLEAVFDAPYEMSYGIREAEWKYSVDVQPAFVEGLLQIVVTVVKNVPGDDPPQWILVRWLPDPDAVPVEEES